jgi:hypothetical protein
VSGAWSSLTGSSAIGGGYRINNDATTGDTFTWLPRITESGKYDVQVHYVPGADRATNAPYAVYYNGPPLHNLAVREMRFTPFEVLTWNRVLS